jgi:hypothetical protein
MRVHLAERKREKTPFSSVAAVSWKEIGRIELGLSIISL